MSRLTNFLQSKDLEAKSIAGYCANHPCPVHYFCHNCIGQFEHKENLKEFLNALVQIKH